jgi:hypothetical protein
MIKDLAEKIRWLPLEDVSKELEKLSYNEKADLVIYALKMGEIYQEASPEEKYRMNSILQEP